MADAIKHLPLRQSRFEPAEAKIAQWAVNLPIDTPLDALLQPRYWAHVASQLHQRDIIHVMPEDGSWYAMLVVKALGPQSANVKVVNHTVFASAAAAVAPDGFRVEHIPAHKWRVLRVEDKAVINKGFETKEEAEGWLSAHLKTING